MKKLYVFLLAVISLAMFMPSCGSTNSLEKARQNMANQKLKELKKAGWEIYGTSKTLEVALLDFYSQLDDDDAIELVGEALTTDKHLGSTKALKAAQEKYAESARSTLEGRMKDEMSSEIDNGDPKEWEHFYASYKSEVAKEMNGQIKPCFTIIRNVGKNSKGVDKFEMQTYCVVNEVAASNARQRAYVMSARENDMVSKYGLQISNYVKDVVRVDN